MLTIACCLVVGLGLGIGLALVSGWLVVMDVYSYHFFCHCHIDSRVEIPGRDDGVTRTTSIMSQPAQRPGLLSHSVVINLQSVADSFHCPG